MEDITNTDPSHEKRVGQDFEITRFSENYDLYVQSDTVLLADVFNNLTIFGIFALNYMDLIVLIFFLHDGKQL